MSRNDQRQVSMLSVSSEPLESVHRPPTPKPRRGVNYQRYVDAFEKIPCNPRLFEEFMDSMRALGERRAVLQAGKGGWLIERPSVFDVPNQWVDGYLDLHVDEQHQEVRRLGWPATVTFKTNSKEWQVFQMAWEAGAQGCSVEDWKDLESELEIVGISKCHRQSVSNKLAVIGLRLALRCPPRLIEVEENTR